MNKVVIFGHNQNAELVYYYLTKDTDYEVVGFTVDGRYLNKTQLFGLPVVPYEDVHVHFPPLENYIYIPIGYQRLNRLREERYIQAKDKGYELITYVSSKAFTWTDLHIGKNCIVSELTSIGPSVKIGDNVAIGPNVVIGHHSTIGDHCFIAAGAVVLGCANIEPYCLLGANSTIKEGITIGSECVIGSGVFITNDTKNNGVYINEAPTLLKKPSNEFRTWFRSSPLIKKQG